MKQSKSPQYTGDESSEVGRRSDPCFLNTPIEAHHGEKNNRYPPVDIGKQIDKDGRKLPDTYPRAAGADGKLPAFPKEAALGQLMAAASVSYVI